MANTITGTVASVVTTEEQAWNTLFPTMYTFTGTVSDQDAITAATVGEFDVTVTGVALGDIVLGVSINKDLTDTDSDVVTLHAYVSAANTVTVQLLGDGTSFTADYLNSSTVKMLIGRAGW